jgi:hypothetical protein
MMCSGTALHFTYLKSLENPGTTSMMWTLTTVTCNIHMNNDQSSCLHLMLFHLVERTDRDRFLVSFCTAAERFTCQFQILSYSSAFNDGGRIRDQDMWPLLIHQFIAKFDAQVGIVF